MAKLWFNEDKNTDHFVVATKTATDESYIHGIHTLHSVDITDAEFDSLSNGSKTFTCVDGTVTWSDFSPSSDTMDRENYERSLNEFKKQVDGKITFKTSHSKITEFTALKTYLDAIDLDSKTYPVTNLVKELIDNNKFVDLRTF